MTAETVGFEVELDSGLVETLREEPGLFAFTLVALFGLGEKVLGDLFETRVGDQAHRVGYALGLAVVIHSRYTANPLYKPLSRSLPRAISPSSH
jgi:hypothetical protein